MQVVPRAYLRAWHGQDILLQEHGHGEAAPPGPGLWLHALHHWVCIVREALCRTHSGVSIVQQFVVCPTNACLSMAQASESWVLHTVTWFQVHGSRVM